MIVVVVAAALVVDDDPGAAVVVVVNVGGADVCGGPLTEVEVGSGSARGLENAVVAVNSAVAVVEERSEIVDELVEEDLARVVEESPVSVVVIVDMSVELVEALSDDVSIVEGDSSAVTLAEPVAGLIAPPEMAAETDPM